jgi:vacuolar-type H+-ATPase subunit E/Vma4
MTTTEHRQQDAREPCLAEVLEPVRIALLSDARAEADRIVSAATSAAETAVAKAEAESLAAVERAVRRTERSSLAHSKQVLARAGNDNHREVLSTREQIRQELINEVRSAARDLRHDPRYPALLDHLETLARSQLGDEAVITRDLDTDGGIVAETGRRRVDYRLPLLADRALDHLADEVAELWA